MKEIFALTAALFILLLSSSALADKARFIDDDADSIYHANHLKQHEDVEGLACTGNYVKVRAEAGGKSEVLGHLEQADAFILLEMSETWACIQVTRAASTSPDSWDGLYGWVNADYIQCLCSEEDFYRTSVDDEFLNFSSKQAYFNYLQNETDYLSMMEGYDYISCSLIFVDEDDVPELVINSGAEAGGCLILTYHNGLVDALQTRRLHFTYLEKENLLSNSAGHMDSYYDDVYMIKNGRWEQVATGEYSGCTDGWSDEYGRYICQNYVWNGKETTMEAYMEQFYTLYDEDRAIEPIEKYSLRDMLNWLMN